MEKIGQGLKQENAARICKVLLPLTLDAYFSSEAYSFICIFSKYVFVSFAEYDAPLQNHSRCRERSINLFHLHGQNEQKQAGPRSKRRNRRRLILNY